MTENRRDLIGSILFLVFGAFMFIQSIPIVPIMGRDLGSGFVPKIVAGAIIVTAAVKLVFALTAMSKETKAEKEKAIQKKKDQSADDDMKGGLFTIASLLVYALIFQSVGFIISTVLYLFVQIMVLSDKTNRKPVLFAIISVAATLFIYVVFVHLIKMPLPAGILR